MSRYIDADRLIRRLENRTYKAVPNFIKMINEQEAADVEEVRHGRWEKMDGTDLWCCSVCGNAIYSEDETIRGRFHKWCGRCGAKMRSIDDEVADLPMEAYYNKDWKTDEEEE